jgi:hypothetical protein
MRNGERSTPHPCCAKNRRESPRFRSDLMSSLAMSQPSPQEAEESVGSDEPAMKVIVFGNETSILLS